MATTILVVDDYAAFVETLVFALTEKGFETRTACEGARALEILDSEPIDVVLLDVMMPDLDGLEVCQRIRRNPKTAKLPIIMLSARTQVADRLKGFDSGADYYIPKPADPREIIARIKALVNRTQPDTAPG